MITKRMSVIRLFIKPASRGSMRPVESLSFSSRGIDGQAVSCRWRQVLLLPTSTLQEFELLPGQLRENIIVDNDDLHELESGTLLHVGGAEIRLTFHCEPCGRVKNCNAKTGGSNLNHKRGYLGQFLNAGTISVGDSVKSAGVVYEAIPYHEPDRIRWFLEHNVSRTFRAADLLIECGIPTGYARALPRYLETFPPELAKLVTFDSHRGNSAEGVTLPYA